MKALFDTSIAIINLGLTKSSETFCRDILRLDGSYIGRLINRQDIICSYSLQRLSDFLFKTAEKIRTGCPDEDDRRTIAQLRGMRKRICAMADTIASDQGVELNWS